MLATQSFAQSSAQISALHLLNGNRPVLDAHNCYPYEGKWKDRIERALSTGFPVAIEQDLAWANGRPVLSHTKETTGAEPALREYFFERVRGIVESALERNDRYDAYDVAIEGDILLGAQKQDANRAKAREAR